MKKQNPKRITEAQVRTAVRSKYERMKAEVKRNPHNIMTVQRLAEFKTMHKSKLEGI